jgi:hypothetical protein
MRDIPRYLPKPVPPGEYDFEVVKAFERISAKGNLTICLELNIPRHKSSFFYNLTRGQYFAKYAKKLFNCSGRPLIKDYADVSAEDFLGLTGRVRLIVDNYKGRTINKVDYWMRPNPPVQYQPAPVYLTGTIPAAPVPRLHSDN